MEHLVTTTFYDGPRRVPCLRDRGHGGIGEEGRGKRRERSRGTFGTEKQPTENTGSRAAVPSKRKGFPDLFAWKIFRQINCDESLECTKYYHLSSIDKSTYDT